MFDVTIKRKFVISAVNFYEGGPLTLLVNLLSYLDSSELSTDIDFIILVHKKSMFPCGVFKNLNFIEYPSSRGNYFIRLKLEYIDFHRLAFKLKIDYWLSLHDVSPRLRGVRQFVYCHNPSIFRKLTVRDILDQPKLFMFTLFYRYVYRFNIHSNSFIIVQQDWIRREFVRLFSIPFNKIIVAPPQIPLYTEGRENDKSSDDFIFFYPTLARPFKNIEIICKAVEYLQKNSRQEFQVIITIDGSENNYSRRLVDKYSKYRQLKFCGMLPKENVFETYRDSSCLIFPSLLETWGLPISEYKFTNKPMIVSNLPYAIETIGDYKYALLFDPNDFLDLSNVMEAVLTQRGLDYYIPNIQNRKEPFAEDWQKLFKLLLTR